ncbi:MAG: VWA domain-containing protein [Thalassobaculum sp.]
MLTQGAIVVLITDGLDREVGAGLNKEMERLHKSCRRLISAQSVVALRWLRPQMLRGCGPSFPCRRLPAGTFARQPRTACGSHRPAVLPPARRHGRLARGAAPG